MKFSSMSLGIYTLNLAIVLVAIVGTCISASEVDNIVTDAFFNGIISRSGPDCAGRRFYTRGAFLNAAGSYPAFGSSAPKHEIAAFFAHVTHETEYMCYIVEKGGSSTGDYCNPSYTEWPCVPGQQYHGRGPLQLTWNYNYGTAGRRNQFDGLHNPHIVAADNVISFKASLWFWMENCHSAITSGQGFGATIRAINSMECNNGNRDAVNSRVSHYVNYCNQLGINPGANLGC